MEKVKKTICGQNGNINKEIENVKGNQKEILDLKSTITETKNSLEGFKGRFEPAEKSVNLIEQWTLYGLMSSKKNEQSQRDLWDTIKADRHPGVPEIEERKGREYLKE